MAWIKNKKYNEKLNKAMHKFVGVLDKYVIIGCTYVWSSSEILGINLSTIIPRVWMGSESIGHEAEGWMSYWLRGHEGERN